MSEVRQESNPWWIVVGSVLALFVSGGPVYAFTFGLFVGPLVREFGWSRGTISMGIGAGLIMAAAGAPLAGFAIDQFGVRRVTLFCIVLFSLSVASISLAATPVVFVLLHGAAGLFSSGHAPLSYAQVISSRFDERRGLALGFAMAGVGLGAAIVPLIASILIGTWGWRGTYVALGAMTLAIAFPAVAILVKSAGSKQSLAAQPGSTARDAFRDRRFWYIALVILFVALATNGTIAHTVPLLADKGFSTQTAASALAVMGVALIIGRLFAGYMLDRVFAPFVAAAFFAVPILGILVLRTAGQANAARAGVAMIGLGLGAEVDLIAFLLSRYFGLRSFARLYGFLFMLFAIGSGVGPYLMGLTFDLTGSYNVALTIFCCCLSLSVALVLLLGPYRFPKSVGNAQEAVV